MNSDNIILIMAGAGTAVVVILLLLYFRLRKKMQTSDVARIEKLRKTTEVKSFSWDVFYQKLYIRFQRTFFLKTYLLKIRRRLEINNIDDEFTTRRQTAEIIFKALCIVVPLTIVVIILTYSNPLLLFSILILELFIIDSFTDNLVNKIDNKLLEDQIDFFAKMRHSYHETSMVAEAIYSTAQDSDNVEISRQAEKIYEILNSSDPEIELEKYYDVAPNNYLKEFAGISYLTQEFGDRKENGVSIYLKNLENISREMQLEILKRDKLNYVFQSLSWISIAPIVMLEPLKKWAVSNFSFTKSFYNGSKGMLTQILIMVLTFVSYIMVRRLKDTGQVKRVQDEQNPWENRLYKKKPIKKFVDLFIPKKKTKEYRDLQQLLKDAGSKKKIPWLYIDKLSLAILCFIVTICVSLFLHHVEIKYVYQEPTSDYDMIGEMDSRSEQLAMEKTKRQNKLLDKFRGKPKTTKDEITKEMKKMKDYQGFKDSDLKTETDQVYSKLQQINAEYLKWFEVLIALGISGIGYAGPTLMLKFTMLIRKMEMEDEVMQYQTIIMMLMKLERVDVEMILEWIERYADIFKDPISKCLNNYESGAWEALEQMKDEVSYQPFIQIIESLQTAVERVPIREAFEELDAEQDYYRDKRKETNDRLISQKATLGKVIGFAPMVLAFVVYLILPLCLIGMKSMNSTFSNLSSQSSQPMS